jgi:phosphopantothenoylcysteine decarboxylase/phosphopantothenate--cysteine ligase
MAYPAPRVLLGVTGGIAAYKSLELVRLMTRANWPVSVVMTRAACRFVGPESFRALTGNPVALELFPNKRPARRVQHVDIAADADLVVVAPATANIIGRLASGIADDLLSTVLLAVPQQLYRSGRVLVCPAMNSNMWSHPSVAANIERLRALGCRIVAPGSGELACGTSGPGRMAEPGVIFEGCRDALAAGRALAGMHVVVTAGRTEEPLDPVRIITNRSSGRMGVAVARACAEAGAGVTLVAGAMTVPAPAGMTAVTAVTTDSMLAAVTRLLSTTDVLVMCAAVADYRPVKPARAKQHAPALRLRLVRTPNILGAVSRRHHHALVVGFSLDAALGRARHKLRDKQLDLIVANPPTTAGSESIAARLLYRDGRTTRLPAMSKTDFARRLVSAVAELARPGRTPTAEGAS